MYIKASAGRHGSLSDKVTKLEVLPDEILKEGSGWLP